jgi:hypothetical protein
MDLAEWLDAATVDYQEGWQTVDDELYDLCLRRGNHDFPDVLAKVTFVDRVYGAGLRRAELKAALVNKDLQGDTAVARQTLAEDRD